MKYSKKMKTKFIDIEAGKMISIIHEKDAKELGVFPLDRVELFNPKTRKKIITVVDTTDSMVKEKEIGLFNDVRKRIGLKKKAIIIVSPVSAPESVDFIKKKMDGHSLNEKEIKEIVEDITSNYLSQIEASAFVSAVYMKGLNLFETIAMTKALVEGGKKLRLSKKFVVDKHSIGGVNGRATMVVVPIIAANGLFIPKTSSRSITSAAGTADSMEVLAKVNLPMKKIKSITEKIGGVIAWGGGLDLAPGDDKIIAIEHPLNLDPPGQVIASVMAKKVSVGAKYLVIDIPVGQHTKVKTKESAENMAKKFLEVSKKMGIKTEVLLTDGTKPNGPAFGAALEAKHAMEILEGKIFDNLAQKSCQLAGALFELTGKTRKGKGYKKAVEILKSGKALKKMKEIIKAQEGKTFSSEKIKLSSKKIEIRSDKNGKIDRIDLSALKEIARKAGAPADQKAGLLLKVEEDDLIKKGQIVFEIHGENTRKLEVAREAALKDNPIKLGEIVIEKMR
ncbi:MAG: AMP phosphorylase [archaeon]